MMSISPGWKNPRELMRQHVLKRKSSRKLLQIECGVSLTNSDEHSVQLSTNRPINPFKTSPNKRISLDEKENIEPGWGWELVEDGNANDAVYPDSRLRKLEMDIDMNIQKQFSPVDFSYMVHSTPKSEKLSKKKQGLRNFADPSFPMDIRPGTLFRIISDRPFSWIDFQPDNVANPFEYVKLGMDAQSENTSHSFLSHLKSATFYYQYPSLFFINSFPRLENKSKLVLSRDSTNPSIATLFSGKDSLQHLNNEWKESLLQLFRSWCDNYHTSFYVCCPTFTVVFFKINSDHKAVVTPTTFGLRKLLRSLGIDAKTPLKTSNSRRSSQDGEQSQCSMNIEVTQSQPPLIVTREENDTESSPDKLNSSADSDQAAWLKDIGISPLSTLKLRRYSSTSGNSTHNSIESEEDQIKSAVLVDDLDSLQTLYEFLLDNKACRTATGVQAGMPPTLLADRPFINASIKTLQTSSHRSSRGNNSAQFVFEIKGGPLLPSTIDNLCRLFHPISTSKTTVSIGGRHLYPGMNSVFEQHDFKDIDQFSLGSDFR